MSGVGHAILIAPKVVYSEMLLLFSFSWRDWSASVIPGSIYTVAALRSLDEAPSKTFVVTSLVRSFVYFLLFICSFNVANQISGIVEDRVNKPDRPLPSNRISLRGAYIRGYAITSVYLCVGAAWGVLPWTIFWVMLTIHYNFLGGGNHWITKNLLFVSLGTVCLLKCAWELVTPMNARELRWVIVQSAMSGVGVNIQDLRDIEGDKVAGRRTLPIILGSNYRSIMAAMILACNSVFWFSGHLDGFCGMILGFAMFYLAYRVFIGRTKLEDHKTYMVLTYIFCGFLAERAVFPT